MQFHSTQHFGTRVVTTRLSLQDSCVYRQCIERGNERVARRRSVACMLSGLECNLEIYNESLIHFESGTRTDSRDSVGYAVLLIGDKNSIAFQPVYLQWRRMSSIYICVWNVSKGEAEQLPQYRGIFYLPDQSNLVCTKRCKRLVPIPWSLRTFLPLLWCARRRFFYGRFLNYSLGNSFTKARRAVPCRWQWCMQLSMCVLYDKKCKRCAFVFPYVHSVKIVVWMSNNKNNNMMSV